MMNSNNQKNNQSFSNNKKKSQKIIDKIMNNEDDLAKATSTSSVIKRALVTSALATSLVAVCAQQASAGVIQNLGAAIINDNGGAAVVNNGANVALANATYVWYGNGGAQSVADLANLTGNVASPLAALSSSAVTLVIDQNQAVNVNTGEATAAWTFSSMPIYLATANDQIVTFNACESAINGSGSFTAAMLTVGAIGTANVANFTSLSLVTNGAAATYGINNLKQDMRSTLPGATNIGEANIGALVLDGQVVETSIAGSPNAFYTNANCTAQASIALNTWSGLSALTLDPTANNGRTAVAIVKIAKTTLPSWTMGNAPAANVNGANAGVNGLKISGANVAAKQSALIVCNDLKGEGTINALQWGGGNAAANAVGLILAHSAVDKLIFNLAAQDTGAAAAPNNANPMGVGLYDNGMGLVQTGAGSTTLNVSAISGDVCSTADATGTLNIVSASPVATAHLVLKDSGNNGGNIWLDAAAGAEKVVFTIGNNVANIAENEVVLNRKVDFNVSANAVGFGVAMNILKNAIVNINASNASNITIASLTDASLTVAKGPIALNAQGGGELNANLQNANASLTITDLTLKAGGVVRGASAVTTANISQGALVAKTATTITFGATMKVDSIDAVLSSCASASATLDHSTAAFNTATNIAKDTGGSLILSTTQDQAVKVNKNGGGNGYLALTMLNPSNATASITALGTELLNFQRSAVLIRNASTQYAYTVKAIAADYIVFDGVGNTSTINVSDAYSATLGTIVRTKGGVNFACPAPLHNLRFAYADGMIRASNSVTKLYMHPDSLRGVLNAQSDVTIDSSGSNTLANLVLTFAAPKKSILGQTNGTIMRDGAKPLLVGGDYVGSVLGETEAPIAQVDVEINHPDSVVILASLEKNNLSMQNGAVKILGALKSAKIDAGILTVGGVTTGIELKGGKANLNSVVKASIHKDAVLNVKTAESLELLDGAKVYIDTKADKVAMQSTSELYVVGGNSVSISNLVLSSDKASGTIDTSGLTTGSLRVESQLGSASAPLNRLVLGGGAVYLNDESVINSLEIKSTKPAGLYLRGGSETQAKVYTINQTSATVGAVALPINIQDGVAQLNISQSTDKNAITPNVFLGQDGVVKITDSTNLNISAFGSSTPKNTAVLVVGAGIDKSEITLAGKIGATNLKIGALNLSQATVMLTQDVNLSTGVILSDAALKINTVLSTPSIQVAEESTQAVLIFNNPQNVVINMAIGSEAKPLSLVQIQGKDVTFSGALYTNAVQYVNASNAQDTKTVLSLGKGIACNFDVISESNAEFWIGLSGAQTITHAINIKNGGILCTTDDLLKVKSDIGQISIISDKASGGTVLFEAGEALVLRNVGTSSNALASVSINKRTVNTTGSFAAKKLELTSSTLVVDGNAVILESNIDAASALYFGGMNSKVNVNGTDAHVYLHKLKTEGAQMLARREFELTLGTAKIPLALVELDAATTSVLRGAVFAKEIKNLNNIALDGTLTISAPFTSENATWNLARQTMTLAGNYTGAMTGGFNLDLDVDAGVAGAIVVGDAYTYDMSGVNKMVVSVRPAQTLVNSLNNNNKPIEIKLFTTKSSGVLKLPELSQISVNSTNNDVACRFASSGALLLYKKDGAANAIPTTTEEIASVTKEIGASQSTVSVLEEYNQALIESVRNDPNGKAAAIQQRNNAIAAVGGSKAVITAQIQEMNNPASIDSASTAQTFSSTITDVAMGNGGGTSVDTAYSSQKGAGVAAGDAAFSVRQTNTWVRPLYNFGNQNALATTPGYKMGQFGVVTGVNHTVDQTMFGFAVGYLNAKNKSKGVTAGAKSNVKSVILSCYAKKDFTEQSAVSVLFAYTGGTNRITNPRTALVNGATSTVIGSASCHSNNFVLQMRGDYNHAFGNGHFVNPYMSVTALSLGAMQYTEKANHLPDRMVRTAGSTVAQMIIGTSYSIKNEFNDGSMLCPSIYGNLLFSTKNTSKTTVNIDGISPIITPAAENQAFMFNVGLNLDIKSRDGLELGLNGALVGANKYVGFSTNLVLRVNF